MFQWQFLTFKKPFASTNCELFTAIREAVLVDSISGSHRKATSAQTMVGKSFQMAVHGLYTGVILTTYDTWDDPPSTHSSLSAQLVSSLRKPLAIRQFGVNSLQELLNMIKDTMEILSSFLGVFLNFLCYHVLRASFRDVFYKDTV